MKKENLVGDNIRQLREVKKMTQESLALKSSLSQGYINQLENGKRRYTQKTLELIADALSVPIAELFRNQSAFPDKPRTETTKIHIPAKNFKDEITSLMKDLPHNIVEHYLTLIKLEKELLKKTGTH